MTPQNQQLSGYQHFSPKYGWASNLLNRSLNGFLSMERDHGWLAFKLWERLRAFGEVAESG